MKKKKKANRQGWGKKWRVGGNILKKMRGTNLKIMKKDHTI